MARFLVVSSGSMALLLWASQALAGPAARPLPGASPNPMPPPASSPVEDARSSGTHTSYPTPTVAAPTAATPRTPEDPFAGQREASEEAQQSWSYSTGEELRPNYVRPEHQSILSINPIGYYQGVSVRGDQPPPFPATAGARSAVLTWTGFERTETGSRVFFQLSAAVTPSIETESLRVTVRLPQTSVNVINNRRRLDTSFFDTPVTEVKIHRHGSETVATLMLRSQAIPQWSVIPGSNGYQLLVIEFLDRTPAPAPGPGTGSETSASSGS